MAAESSVSTRRRTTARSSKEPAVKSNNSSNSVNSASVNGNAFKEPAETVAPSRIPIKSPSRSAIGGLAMAYSPIRQSSPSFKDDHHNHHSSSNSQSQDSSSYSKRMAELRNAMDLLKTPPAPQPQIHSNLVSSYTPLKASSLNQVQSTSPFASALDTIEITMETSTASETDGADLTMEIDISTDQISILDGNINNTGASRPINRVYDDSSFFTSPRINEAAHSSPYPSSEELKKRLEATREAFQRSLEAQKRRLRSSLNFSELDSSFSTCSAATGSGFESDYSVDSLRDAREQLARIKKEMSEIIDSDLEELETIKHKKKATGDDANNLIRPIESESILATFFKFASIFSILTVIFTYSFISYAPSWDQILLKSSAFLCKKAVLEKIEEFVNFLLQDN